MPEELKVLVLNPSSFTIRTSGLNRDLAGSRAEAHARDLDPTSSSDVDKNGAVPAGFGAPHPFWVRQPSQTIAHQGMAGV